MNPWLSAFYSSISFALMSFFVKLALISKIPPLDLTFYRFLLGSVFFVLYFSFSKEKFHVHSWKFALLRAITNIIAVSLFYYSIMYLDLGVSNLLNLTYPIFISILSPFFLKERTSKLQALAVILSSLGVYILLSNNQLTYQVGVWVGLACGFVSAITIMTLKQARKFDSSVVIVSVLMGAGSICTMPFYSFQLPTNGMSYLWILLASLCALSGQLFITYSFKGLSSLQGSLVSSSRILIAFVLGVSFLNDSFEMKFFLSGGLILLGVYLSQYKSKRTKKGSRS